MPAGWKTLENRNNSLTIDLSEEEEEDWKAVKGTTRRIKS